MVEAGRNAGQFNRVDFSTTFKDLLCYDERLATAALTIERVLATYRLGHYEREGKYVGPTLAAMVLLLSILCMRWGLAATDDAEVLAQCAGIPNSATPRMSVIYFIMLIVDLISMLVFAYCLYHNKRKLNSGMYSLDLRYEIQGNVKVLRILFPIVISHLFVFGLFIIGNIVIRNFREKLHIVTYAILLIAVYVPPYFFLIVSSWIYMVLKCELRALKDFQDAIEQRPEPKLESDAYFNSLRNQWF
ncbi:unnamed protein product [Cylicocyclus nassatus]|uniref:Uncharacterized protein n=1 Tax=Cylicocyclus nassatus TaxID=53992 RepID=A0AA36HBM9_CYLNA|nr:unnamed protein product [Cylicocyclus nassatus]